MSNPQQVGQDVQALYGALHSGYTEADGRAMILLILTFRSRAHLREIDAVYGGTQGGALKAALSERFKGGLRRGVLLLERSEVYYARSSRRLPRHQEDKGLERGALLGGSTKTLGDRMQAGGLYTHDDTSSPSSPRGTDATSPASPTRTAPSTTAPSSRSSRRTRTSSSAASSPPSCATRCPGSTTRREWPRAGK